MPDALTVTRPVKVWNKPLESDFKSLFKAMSKTAIHGATGEWTKASTNFSDALTAVGLEDEPEQLGWVLIFRALSRAMFDLVEESSPHFFPGDHDFDSLADDLDLSLEATDVTIDSSFFDRPKELPLIADMSEPFRTWLIGVGLDKAAAQSVSDRLDRLGRLDLRGRNMVFSSLPRANFTGCCMDGVPLNSAVLNGATLEKASLKGADSRRGILLLQISKMHC